MSDQKNTCKALLHINTATNRHMEGPSKQANLLRQPRAIGEWPGETRPHSSNMAAPKIDPWPSSLDKTSINWKTKQLGYALCWWTTAGFLMVPSIRALQVHIPHCNVPASQEAFPNIQPRLLHPCGLCVESGHKHLMKWIAAVTVAYIPYSWLYPAHYCLYPISWAQRISQFSGLGIHILEPLPTPYCYRLWPSSWPGNGNDKKKRKQDMFPQGIPNGLTTR